MVFVPRRPLPGADQPLPSHPFPSNASLYRVLELTLRIGEEVLAGGGGAYDVVATMRAVADAYGVAGLDPDVTFTTMWVSVSRGRGAAPVTAARTVRRRGTDGTRITEIHNLVDDLLTYGLTLAEAEDRLDRIRAAPPRYPRWLVSLAYGAMAAGISVQLGGRFVVAGTAFAATLVIDRGNRWLNGRRLPFFYQNVFGGLVATLAAGLLSLAGAQVRPALVVASCIVVLLPGMVLVGAVQDGLSGYLVTAGARALEVVLLTTGIVAGIAVGLDLLDRLGADVVVTARSGPLSTVPVQALASAVAAVGYAIAVRSPRRVLAPAGLAALLGFLAFSLLQRADFSRPVSSGAAAVAIGVIAQVLSERQRVAPLLVVVSGVFPLLPGLTIFAAMLQLSMGDTGGGFVTLLQALTTALAIAAGVLLGELLAQGVRRDVLKQGRRNTGPRLLMPLRRRPPRS